MITITLPEYALSKSSPYQTAPTMFPLPSFANQVPLPIVDNIPPAANVIVPLKLDKGLLVFKTTRKSAFLHSNLLKFYFVCVFKYAIIFEYRGVLYIE